MERRTLLLGAAGAVVAGGAQASAAHAGAAVPGLWSNDFTSHSNGWSSVRGSWYRSAGTWQAVGLPGAWASTKHSGFFADFTYIVRMRRAGGSPSSSNSLYLRGDPTFMTSNGEWVPLDVFSYTNSGMASVWRVNRDTSHTVLMPWTKFPFLTTAYWKTIRVDMMGTSMVFYINGRRLWYGQDPLSYGYGVVGAAFATPAGVTSARLLIDSASLRYTERHARTAAGRQAVGRVVGGGSLERAPE